MFFAVAHASQQPRGRALACRGYSLDAGLQAGLQFTVASDQQLDPWQGLYGLDQGLEPFVIGEPANGKQPQAGVTAPLQAFGQVLGHWRDGAVDAQGDDGTFAAPGP